MSNAEYERLTFDLERLEEMVRCALDELGVPTPDYPAPVANAVRILRRALHIDGDGCA